MPTLATRNPDSAAPGTDGPATPPGMPATAPSGAHALVPAASPARNAPAAGEILDEDPPLKRSTMANLKARLERLWERDRSPAPEELTPLFTARATDVAANRLAAQWRERYAQADGRGRRALLDALAHAAAASEPLEEHAPRLFKRLNALPDALRFLVELRADMLRWRKQVGGLQPLERALEGLLSNWFDVGMLELRPITWDSPASLLEKLIQYEAVHEIRSWDDLRNRVGPDRRCYAFFHPRMSDVPLIFVEVAFSSQMADNVQSLLDTQTPAESLDKVRWAIFYSISNTQAGLRGISFGNFLLKRVVDELLRELPRLRGFATLSPIPGFADWLQRQDAKALLPLLHEKKAATRDAAGGERAGVRWAARLRQAATGRRHSDLVQRNGMRLAAHYLQTLKNGQPLDPVARFHLGNGARLERLNWAADTSDKGLAQSCGLMVNYLYDLRELDENLARLAQGKPRVSSHVSRLV